MGARAEPWRERVNAQSGNGDNNGGKWPECGLCSLHPMDLLSELGTEGILISHSEDDDSHSEEAFQSSVDVHANGCLLLRMTVMLAWSNRCVPLNKLNC